MSEQIIFLIIYLFLILFIWWMGLKTGRLQAGSKIIKILSKGSDLDKIEKIKSGSSEKWDALIEIKKNNKKTMAKKRECKYCKGKGFYPVWTQFGEDDYDVDFEPCEYCDASDNPDKLIKA